MCVSAAAAVDEEEEEEEEEELVHSRAESWCCATVASVDGGSHVTAWNVCRPQEDSTARSLSFTR